MFRAAGRLRPVVNWCDTVAGGVRSGKLPCPDRPRTLPGRAPKAPCPLPRPRCRGHAARIIERFGPTPVCAGVLAPGEF